jgi:hypothetical protein
MKMLWAGFAMLVSTAKIAAQRKIVIRHFYKCPHWY